MNALLSPPDNGAPRILPGCSVLPPMEPADRRHARREPKPPAKRQPQGKAKRSTRDRFHVLNTFADFAIRDLDRAEIAVWLLLWRDTRKGTARTSQANLAERAGVSERTARRAVQRLHRTGLLTIVHRGGLKKGPSTYRVHPLPAEAT